MKKTVLVFLFLMAAVLSKAQSCPDNNHPHAIDLGLPSGTKWACCNIGAKNPTDCGNYYAWAETEDKSVYSMKSYKLSGDGTKYGIKIRLRHLNWHEMKNNVAHVQWGNPWQMPTRGQFEEILNNCNPKWTTIKGVSGMMFTGKNGNSIFLPAAGQHSAFSLYSKGVYGYYWSEEQIDNSTHISKALYLYFYNNKGLVAEGDVSLGRTVRAIVNN